MPAPTGPPLRRQDERHLLRDVVDQLRLRLEAQPQKLRVLRPRPLAAGMVVWSRACRQQARTVPRPVKQALETPGKLSQQA